MNSDTQVQPTIRFPAFMPPFSSENPIQALYLKKRGVEKLLARYAGITMGVDFAKETKTKIEKESMLIDRREKNVGKLFFPKALETIYSIGDDTSQHEAAAEVEAAAKIAATAIDDDDKCPELSCYDSDMDSDWSLPGIKESATDIRYVYGDGGFYDDGDFYDSENWTRRIGLTNEEQQERSGFINTIRFITRRFICHPEDHFTIYDWIRCT